LKRCALPFHLFFLALRANLLDCFVWRCALPSQLLFLALRANLLICFF